MRFVIAIPPYDPCSGGVRVMHYLPALLSSSGAQVATTSQCFYSPAIPIESECREGDIAIYPDIEPGNPLKAKMVCRYMLYFASEHYARMGGTNIPKTEMVLVYMKDFLADIALRCESAISEADIFEIPNIESSWCFAEDKTIPALLFEGKRTCKDLPVAWMHRVPSPADIPNRWALRNYTLQLLRRSESVYTMDHYTVLEQESVLCGCRTFRVVGKDMFEPSPWTHDECERRLMIPKRDFVLGDVFVARAKRFFNL
jgi:hypothetical protein